MSDERSPSRVNKWMKHFLGLLWLSEQTIIIILTLAPCWTHWNMRCMHRLHIWLCCRLQYMHEIYTSSDNYKIKLFGMLQPHSAHGESISKCLTIPISAEYYHTLSMYSGAQPCSKQFLLMPTFTCWGVFWPRVPLRGFIFCLVTYPHIFSCHILQCTSIYLKMLIHRARPFWWIAGGGVWT